MLYCILYNLLYAVWYVVHYIVHTVTQIKPSRGKRKGHLVQVCLDRLPGTQPDYSESGPGIKVQPVVFSCHEVMKHSTT